jgi:hypothetical protein
MVQKMNKYDHTWDSPLPLAEPSISQEGGFRDLRLLYLHKVLQKRIERMALHAPGA